MFDRFIRLAKARKALDEGRLEDAVRLAQDPLVASDRRAEVVRLKAGKRLFERAQQRALAGNLSAARLDVEQVLALGQHAGAEELAKQLTAAQQQQQERLHDAQQALQEARKLAEQGRIDSAFVAQQRAAGVPGVGGKEQSVGQFVATRRDRAGQHLAQAKQLLAGGSVDAALEQFRSALALDADATARDGLRARLADKVADRLAEVLQERLRSGNLDGALNEYRRRCVELPEIATLPGSAAALERLGQEMRNELAVAAMSGTAAHLGQQILALEPPLPGKAADELRQAAAELLRAEALREQGLLAEVASSLAAVGRFLGSAELQREARKMAQDAVRSADKVKRARELAGEGLLTEARAELTGILEQWPMHEQARKELALIDQGSKDRERRLNEARDAARGGRLCEASSLALALVVPGPAGEEARLLLKEVRARMDLVARGLDQVRAALHGREAATAEGVRHCMRRLEELCKVQADHTEMPQMVEALQVELNGLELCERTRSAMEQRAFPDAVAAHAELVALRPKLLARDRLDARIVALADRMFGAAEAAVAAGRLQEMELCLSGAEGAAAAAPDIAPRAVSLREQAETRRAEAEAKVAEATARLAARDIAEAERLLDEARLIWVEIPSGRKLDEQLGSLRAQQSALERVEAMAAERDFAGATRRMNDLPPTPALLRTRIFDMKQSLAKAQGLEGGFLLRVDEGGEYLVLRGETISIGNVREGRTDLPVLAAIAGRHARIQRSMSFHGGMRDTLVAEGGEVRVAGQKVQEHRLHPGDRIQLGTALQIQYSAPASRSLTTAITLLGGFQVAGTDRIFLLKDQGRDGRILLGPGKDVHVRVPSATLEVEVFAHKTGQIRVRVDGAGTIEGKPFTGEHPVDAGARVQAGGISFVLLPYVRPA
jgi:hypothetical protein